MLRQATATIPAGHKKGEGSSRAFTPSKKPCARKNRLLLGILFPKKYAVILSPFYAHYNAKPQPQSQPGIKREKDLAELLRRPKSHAQATIACCLASIFPKNNAVILSPFYACCIPKPQPQFQPGIKRVKDLAKLLRRPKSHAQARIACCLASFPPRVVFPAYPHPTSSTTDPKLTRLGLLTQRHSGE